MQEATGMDRDILKDGCGLRPHPCHDHVRAHDCGIQEALFLRHFIQAKETFPGGHIAHEEKGVDARFISRGGIDAVFYVIVGFSDSAGERTFICSK